MLAFSSRQDEADPPRVETILGRQVPQRYSRVLNERGVFGALLRSDLPVYIDPIPDGNERSLPRVAVAVRAGDEVLGSIWAAVNGPLSEERTEALRESAKLVALHMLRVRAGADVQRRVRAGLLSSALEGDASASGALERLGLSARPLLVLGLALDERRQRQGHPGEAPPGPDGAAVAHTRHRLTDAFALHLSSAHPRSAAAAIGPVTYGLLPPGSVEAAEVEGMRVVHHFLDRVGERLPAIAAVGPVALDAPGLAHGRTTVDRVLRVLRERGGDRRIGRLEELQAEALVMELRDIAATRGDRPTGVLANLIDYDRRHRSDLVGTLRAWLESFGDVTAAADSVFVHQNTFRYRLRRVAEVGEIDLLDSGQRFSAMLQLRVFHSESAAEPGQDRGAGA
ncbi:DNA-binding transcriptional regulator, PucR family [Streptomyces sp. WMMB 322]|nr:DNA-binding transcriptional regulator, PucR family [Streptomyces sp. WMMB 322]